MRPHKSIPVNTPVRDSLGVEHRMRKLLVPLEDGQGAGVGAADGRVAQPVEAVVDVDHLVAVLVGGHVGEVVLAPAPLAQHLDAVQLVEDAQPRQVAAPRELDRRLVVPRKLLARHAHAHVVEQGVPGLVALGRRLACVGRVHEVVIKPEHVPHIQARESCCLLVYGIHVETIYQSRGQVRDS